MKLMEHEGAIMTCTVTDCSYNESEECHAESIHVGSDHAMCDTYTKGLAAGISPAEGSVSGCDMGGCHFNSSHHCDANGVTVSMHDKHADCMTFRP